MRKVIVAGGSGFVGGELLRVLKAEGYETVVLSRTTKPVAGADRVAAWDGKTLGDWKKEVDGAYGVINLSGQSIMTRFTPEARKKIRDSRVDSTKAIGEAITQSQVPPSVWINASAIGIYGSDTGDRKLTEGSPHGVGFMPEVCQAWEAAVDAFALGQTRQVKIRIGIVMGQGGGAFEQLSKVTKAFAGGALGDGKQMMSWIHVTDLARMFVWALENPVEGIYNGTAPNPKSNADVMAAFRAVYGRPPIPPAPSFIVPVLARLMNMEAELLLGGSRVIPEMALVKGFRFRFETLSEALEDLVESPVTA